MILSDTFDSTPTSILKAEMDSYVNFEEYYHYLNNISFVIFTLVIILIIIHITFRIIRKRKT